MRNIWGIVPLIQPVKIIAKKTSIEESVARCVGAYGKILIALHADRTLNQTFDEVNVSGIEPLPAMEYLQQEYGLVIAARVRILPA